MRHEIDKFNGCFVARNFEVVTSPAIEAGAHNSHAPPPMAAPQLRPANAATDAKPRSPRSIWWRRRMPRRGSLPAQNAIMKPRRQSYDEPMAGGVIGGPAAHAIMIEKHRHRPLANKGAQAAQSVEICDMIKPGNAPYHDCGDWWHSIKCNQAAARAGAWLWINNLIFLHGASDAPLHHWLRQFSRHRGFGVAAANSRHVATSPYVIDISWNRRPGDMQLHDGIECLTIKPGTRYISTITEITMAAALVSMHHAGGHRYIRHIAFLDSAEGSSSIMS